MTMNIVTRLTQKQQVTISFMSQACIMMIMNHEVDMNREYVAGDSGG